MTKVSFSYRGVHPSETKRFEKFTGSLEMDSKENENNKSLPPFKKGEMRGKRKNLTFILVKEKL